MLKLLLLFAGTATTLAAQSERLGTITFPTSGSPAAQEHFIRGTLYLHSFEYEAAASAYREAQRVDPRFAMAYWGEAMTYNHPVWDQQDRPAAVAALNRLAATPEARAALAPTPGERVWLHAIEVLYGEGTKAQRDTLYSAAMERIAAANPQDLEAQSFYALSLMGLSRTTRVVPTYMRAGAIALQAMARNPHHPGAAHYVIHAFDDPVHAPLGLGAAQAYSGIAPGAAHAQHMTTHIFLALGMWDKVVTQNIVASGTDTTKWKPGHYTLWLGYGLLQQGRFQDAKDHLALLARNTPASDPVSRRASLALMRDFYIINTEQWEFNSAVPNVPGALPDLRAVQAFTAGYAALKQNQLPRARALADTVRTLVEVDGASAAVRVMADELAGLILVSAGDTARGLTLLRQAAAVEDTLPMEFGPPMILKPTHEALGETYLQLGRALDAQREFERALQLAPLRMRSLLGLWRAAKRAGNSDVAGRARADLNSMLRGAVTDPREMVEIYEVGARGHGGARPAVDEALAKDPGNVDLFDLLSNVCVFENNYTCAVDALERLYATDSTKADSTFFTKITVFAAQPLESPDTTRLIKWAQAGVNRYPTNITLLNQLLGAYAMKGQMDSSMSLARRLIELDTMSAAPALFVVNELANRDSLVEALPLIDLIARRGSSEDRENAAILLVNAVFKVLRYHGDSGIADTVRFEHAAGLARRALRLADSTSRAWPNAQYALGLSIVFQVSRMEPELEKQTSCTLARREHALIQEATTAMGRGRTVNPTQVDGYLSRLEISRTRVTGLISSYCG